MAVNASAHRHQVLIGASSEDWSRQLVRFDVGEDKRSPSGLILITGTIALGWTDNVPGGPRVFHPASALWLDRWWRGNRIVVNTTDSSGAFRRDRHGWLYILREPTQPTPDSPELILEVGCELSLKNFDTPQKDESGVNGQSTDRATVINNLLAAAGISATLIDSVPDYPLSAPVPKESGSWVELAGQIAYTGLRSLWQDNQGRIRAIANPILLGSPALSLTIGQDEIAYDPQPGSETPVELMKISGDLKTQVSNYGTESSYEEEYGPAQLLDSTFGGTILVRSIQTTESTSPTEIVRTEVINGTAGLISPTAYPKSTSIVLDTRTVSRRSFDAVDKKLIREKTTIEKLFPASMPEFYETLNESNQNAVKNSIVVDSDATTNYVYTDKETLYRVSTITLRPFGAIAPDEPLANPADPGTGQYDVIRYERQNARVGKRVETTKKAIGLAFPNLEISGGTPQERVDLKTSTLTTRHATFSSRTGQCNPPAVEYAPEPFDETEEPIVGEAKFQLHPNQLANNDREATETVEVGVVSKAQLDRLAQIRGLEKIGRRRAALIQTGLRDEFFDLPPFFQVNVRELDGTIVCYSANAVQTAHDVDRAVVTFEGIWIGAIESTTQVPAPPYNPGTVTPPYVSVTLEQSEGDLAIPLPPAVTFTLHGGIRMGGYVIEDEIVYDALFVHGGIRMGGYVIEDAIVLPEEFAYGGIRMGGYVIEDAIVLPTAANNSDPMGNAIAGGLINPFNPGANLFTGG